MTRKILLALGGLLVLLLAAIFIVPMLIPAAVYEERIETAATEALGRRVTINGAPKIRLFPTEAQVSGLTVANLDGEGFSAPYLLKVDGAAVGVKLFPLLAGRIEITRFDLDSPDIRLEATPTAANWELGAQKTEQQEDSSNAPPAALPDLSLGDVNITGGLISFRAADGTEYSAEEADITLSLESLDQPLTAKGTMVFEGDPARLDVAFATPRSFALNGAAEMTLNAVIGDNRAETILQLSDPLSFSGNMDLDFPALRNLLKLIGADLETSQGFERLRLNGPVTGNATSFAFAQGTTLTIDDIEGSGSLSIRTDGPRPTVTGALTVGTLNLTPYLPPEPEGTAARRSGNAQAFPQWSDEPMDLSALAAVDLDVLFEADAVTMPGISIGETVVKVAGTAGKVTATVQKAQLYGGTGSGRLTADVSRDTPRLGASFTLSDVDANAAATELAGITQLSGRGTIVLDNLVATGRSQAALVDSLSGGVTLSLTDGAIAGINLGRIGRIALETYDAISAGGFEDPESLLMSFAGVTAEARGPSQSTDFSNLGIDLQAQRGVVMVENLQLDGPYYRITGGGRSDLAAQTVALELMAAVSDGAGGAERQLPLPIIVGGTFNAPTIGVNYQDALGTALEQRLQDELKKRGIDLAPGAGLEERIGETATQEVGKLIGNALGARDDKTAAESPAKDIDPADALIQEGLGRLLGGRTRQREGTEPEQPQGDQPQR